jgi:DNA polymerase III delta subunit
MRTLIVARDPLVAEEAALERLPKGVDTRRWYASELNLDLIFQQLGSSDLFATRQSYLYVNVLELKLRKADAERLDSILAHLPAEIDLVCTQVFDALAFRDEERMLKGADLQRWAKGAQMLDLRRVSDAGQAPRWLLERAQRRYGLHLTGQQSQRLLAVAGNRLSLAEGELLKLSLIADGASTIADAQIEEVIAASPAALYWELVDAIMGDSPDSLPRLRTWHSVEPETFRLLSELRRNLLGLRALQQGISVQPPFFAQKLSRIARRWPAPRLSTAIEQLAELEFKLKSGMIPGESSRDAELAALEVFTRGLTAH